MHAGISSKNIFCLTGIPNAEAPFCAIHFHNLILKGDRVECEPQSRYQSG